MANIRKVSSRLAKLSLEERNAKFAALPRMKKRVEIAKDVLAQLDIKRYNAEAGTYMAWTNGSYAVKAETPQAKLDMPTVSCSVCAIGAVFCSRVRLGNEIDDVDSHDGDEMIALMADIFSEEELATMETVFEGSTVVAVDLNENRWQEAQTFRETVADGMEEWAEGYDEKMLRALMQNIINNKGELKLV